MNSAFQSDPAKTIIGVTRSQYELTARVLTAWPIDVEADKLREAMTQMDYAGLCRIDAYALEDCPAPLNAAQKRLGYAWQALAAVQDADANILFHVLVVLLETVVEAAQMPALPPLTFGTREETLAHRPTAAHCRAFQGTKYQPPKTKTPACVDLRPYLCDAKSAALIVTRLRPFWHDAVPQLEQSGYDVRCLQEYSPDNHGLYDIYTRVHHGQDADADAARLPPAFRSVLLPLLRGLHWDTVKRYIALFWSLRLDADAALLAAFARLLFQKNDARTLQWGELLARQPAGLRVTFCCLLAQTGAYHFDPATLDANAMQWLEELDGQPFAAYRLYCLLRALVVGVDTNYLLTGFQLADAYETAKYSFHTVVHSGICPIATIERIAARLSSPQRWRYHSPLRVWEACGKLAGFAQAMGAIAWEAYAPDVVNSYVGIFMSILWHEWKGEREADCWRFARQSIPIMEAMLHSVAPDYQAKCVALFGECVWEWGERKEATALFARACPLIQRLCAPPFRRQLPDMLLFA